MPKARGLKQAYEMRDLAAKEFLALQQGEPSNIKERAMRAKAMRDLGSVWVDACDRIRIMRGKGLPAPEKREPKKSKREAFYRGLVEPVPRADSIALECENSASSNSLEQG